MHLHKKILRLILVMLMISAVILPSAFALGDKAVIKGKNVKAYATSSLQGKAVKIKAFTIVDLNDIEGAAAKITYKNKTMYVNASKIIELDTSAAVEKQLTKATKAWQYPSSGKSVKLKKGAIVNQIAISGKQAIIEKDGKMAYVNAKLLADVEKDPEKTDPFETVVIKDNLKVYKKTNMKKLLGRLEKDTHVTVVALSDTWARIRYDDKTGFCKTSGLEKYTPPKPTIDEIFENESYSNEEKIFHYLTEIDDFSVAAACGILANIKCESGFRPEAYNPNGGSYGICQWLGGRYTNLKNYCADNDLDYTTLKGQCLFLSYELENRYSSVHSYIMDVDPSAQGAYDAAYHWCYYYEIPANRGSVSVTRGNMAKDDFWPKYN